MANTAQGEREPASWYIYIVRCADASLYTGIATDVQRRLAEHNAGSGARYTRSRRPVKLVHVENADDRSSAQRREHQIKQLPTADKRALINESMAEDSSSQQP